MRTLHFSRPLVVRAYAQKLSELIREWVLWIGTFLVFISHFCVEKQNQPYWLLGVIFISQLKVYKAARSLWISHWLIIWQNNFKNHKKWRDKKNHNVLHVVLGYSLNGGWEYSLKGTKSLSNHTKQSNSIIGWPSIFWKQSIQELKVKFVSILE